MLDQCHHQSIGTRQGLPVAVIVVHQSLLEYDLGPALVLSALLCGSFANPGINDKFATIMECVNLPDIQY
jgi:hypothetical protein